MDYMERALELARYALGRTRPNPAVGAVVVRDGRVVGEGYTRPAGGPHAEVVALAQAGDAARGGTLYVTLEPCCHFGRTPPCTRAIIAAGIVSVEVAVLDANPRVHGQGCAELEAARISIRVGRGEEEARQINEAFTKYINCSMPFVTLKWAMTVDGKIASHTGSSRWITGEPARIWVHQMRDVSDAIVVGANTVIADDPQLTVRLPQELSQMRPPASRPPLRVVVSARGRIPLGARIFSPELARGTVVATTEASDADWRREIVERGAEVIVLPERDGQMNLRALLLELGRRECVSVLVEGGGTLNAGLLSAGLVDKVCAFIAPRIVGGREAPSPVDGNGVSAMDDALRLDRLRLDAVGQDILLTGYVVR